MTFQKINNMEKKKPTHLVAHLHFFQTHKAEQKMQKSYQANARGQCKLDTTDLRPKRSPAGNSTLPKVAVQCFVGQFCGYINISASYESLC